MLLQAVHPYLSEFLKHAVAKELVLPTRRRSPGPTAAPGTAVPAGAAAAVHPDAPAVPAAGREAAGPAASDEEGLAGGVEPRGEDGAAAAAVAATLAGGEEDGVAGAGRDGQAGAAAACTQPPEQSMDCSSADDRATGAWPELLAVTRWHGLMPCVHGLRSHLRWYVDAKGMLSDDRPLRFTMQQRRSTRKRGRPSHHGSPVKLAHIKTEEDNGAEAEVSRPAKVQATSSRGRPFKPRASKRASMKSAAAPAQSEAPQGAGGARAADAGPLPLSLAGSAAVSAADTVAGGGPAASEPAASGAASVHAPDTAPDATSGPAGCEAAEQWELVNAHADLLAIAPEDEIVAEIISLQSELAQVC